MNSKQTESYINMTNLIANVNNSINISVTEYRTQLNKISNEGNDTFMESLEHFIYRLKFFVTYHSWPNSEYIALNSHQISPQTQELISWLGNNTQSEFILNDTHSGEKYQFTKLENDLISIQLSQNQKQGNHNNATVIIKKDEFIKSSGLSDYICSIRKQDLSNIATLLKEIGFTSRFLEKRLEKISDDEKLCSCLTINSLYDIICNEFCLYIRNEHKQDNEHYKANIISPKHLTFDGGGSKGIYYAPVMDVLKKVGYLEELTAVYGTSVGSMAATLEAFNINMSEITELAMGCDDIIDNTYINKYPDFTLSNNNGMANGMASVSKLDEKIMNAIKDWLDKQTVISPELSNIQNKVDIYFNSPNTLRYDNDMISFRDLQTLNKYDNNFKLLTITATEKLTGNVTFFSASGTPDIPICKAVRASTAYPIAFKGVVINDIEYVDGGFGSNSSLAAVKETEPNSVASLLFFRPVQNGWSDFYERIYGRSEMNKYNLKELYPVTAALGNLLMNNYSDNENTDAKRVYDTGHHAIPVWHGVGDNDIGTLAFSIKDDVWAYNSFIAKMHIYNYLNNYWVDASSIRSGEGALPVSDTSLTVPPAQPNKSTIEPV
ncbi:TPA: hypothetical protein J6M74_004623 [Escherichia coli]|nr:hypothetical protein [Escherichia coli]